MLLYEWLFAPPGSRPAAWDERRAAVALRQAIESHDACVLVAEAGDGERWSASAPATRTCTRSASATAPGSRTSRSTRTAARGASAGAARRGQGLGARARRDPPRARLRRGARPTPIASTSARAPQYRSISFGWELYRGRVAAMPGRIVLFGATGYTGRLTAEALVARGDRPVLAGRSAERLARAGRAELGGLETAVADVADPASVRALVEPGDVIVATVGPFARWGDPAVEAAIDAGACYLDSTGEPAFIRRVFERFGPARRASRDRAGDRVRLRLGPGQPRRGAGPARGGRGSRPGSTSATSPPAVASAG